MTNLPEQAHQRGGALARRQEDDPYAVDSSMVTLPGLYMAQYQSKAFKARKVSYGDIFVAVGAEDTRPIVIGKGGEPLSEPVRFYVHRIETGFDTAEDPNDLKRKTLGRLGGTYAEALEKVNGDPRRVWQKFGYRITVPGYRTLPVRLFLSGKSAPAGRWLNTQITVLRQEGKAPLSVAFQLQSKPSTNNQGDFVVAVLDLANVKAKDKAADAELVEAHANILASTTVVDSYEVEDAESVDTAAAPGLD